MPQWRYVPSVESEAVCNVLQGLVAAFIVVGSVFLACSHLGDLVRRWRAKR